MPISLPDRLPVLILITSAAFGVFAAMIGASWFVAGKGALFAGFPNNLAEAFAACAGGVAVVIWAIARFRRQVVAQR